MSRVSARWPVSTGPVAATRCYDRLQVLGYRGSCHPLLLFAATSRLPPLQLLQEPLHFRFDFDRSRACGFERAGSRARPQLCTTVVVDARSSPLGRGSEPQKRMDEESGEAQRGTERGSELPD